MLKQILAEMYIDPDLLAELSEEQKQILFFKMREEQIRRWKEREAAMENKECLPVKSRPKKENGKSVHWKLGADKEVWVWVMGEHHLDKPYDMLCDEILAERARLKAEQEAEELRKTQSGGFTSSLKAKSHSSDLPVSGDRETQNVCTKAAEEGGPGPGGGPTPPVKEEKTPEDIVHWFREEQVPLRAGYLGASDSIAPWFHGILTVKRANELLSACVPGSFLVRVSDRTRGYALSYLSDSGCKHFLIDASAGSYSFLGVDQLRHASLADLVEYHKGEATGAERLGDAAQSVHTLILSEMALKLELRPRRGEGREGDDDEPITSLGKELLLHPCGQQEGPPDYLELFE
ncbi:SH2 domain-containing protein 4A [Camelus ferus]|nr:SH2 domain-containing protein 4A [Camelus ferus]